MYSHTKRQRDNPPMYATSHATSRQPWLQPKSGKRPTMSLPGLLVPVAGRAQVKSYTKHSLQNPRMADPSHPASETHSGACAPVVQARISASDCLSRARAKRRITSKRAMAAKGADDPKWRGQVRFPKRDLALSWETLSPVDTLNCQISGRFPEHTRAGSCRI